MNPKNNILVSFVEVLDAVSDAAIVLDMNYNCLFINKEAVSVFNLGKKNPDDLVGKNLFKELPLLKNSTLFKKIKETKKVQKTVLFDDFMYHLKKWYKFRIYPSAQFYLVLSRDITEEVETFIQIKESEEYHRALIENVKDYAIFVLDDKGKIKTWNKGAERLLGYTVEEVIGKSPSIFYGKENRNKDFERKQLQQVKREGKFEQEGWWVRKDGVQFWANEILAYFKDDWGDTRGYTKVVRDMSERKNTEEMLKRYTRDLERSTRAIETEVAKDEALLDSIGEGVIATDDMGKIVVFNKQAQSLLGWIQEDAIGEQYYDVWSTEDEDGEHIPTAKRPVTLALKHGKKLIDSGYYYRSAYRKRFPVSMTTAPIILEGKTIGAVMVFRDISKEKEVDRAKSEFVSLASHQLRTPLTAIKLFVEMLLTENSTKKLSSDQVEMLQSINESNQKMINLVGNLLNVSRLETGVLTVKFEQLILKDFVNEVVKELEPVANERGCHVIPSFVNADGVKVSTDPILLRQVLNNLINNAIAYSVEDRPCDVNVDIVVFPGSMYKITVSDKGIGIPKEALSSIFQRFYRADNAVKARTDGNGLGLYMSKMMTETLGGKIVCVSKINVGTTFTLTFPLSKTRKKQ